jgi:hypothetical protein
VARGTSKAPLRVGAARAAIEVSWPAPLAGHPYPGTLGTGAAAPLEARALVLEAAPLAVALVSLDILTIPVRQGSHRRQKIHGNLRWPVSRVPFLIVAKVKPPAIRRRHAHAIGKAGA